MNLQKRATIFATITAFFLMIIKFVVGFLSGSIAIISSAIDSLLDMCMSIFNLFAVHTAEKDPDHVYNYGRWKIEAIAAFMEGILITLSGLFIFWESIKKIFHNEWVSDLWIAIWVMCISAIVTWVLVLFLWYVARKTKNIVIESDLLHYKSDLLTNSSILLALIIIYFTDFHYIDAIFGIIISVYILFWALSIIKKWYMLLLDISLDKSEVDRITHIILNTPKISSMHALKTRQSSDIKFIEAHLVFNKEISLLEAHTISHNIEDSIRKITNSTYVIMFHLEPYDDQEMENIK